MSGPGRAEAALHRYPPVAGGYPLAVRLTTHEPVTEWYAELILPAGASLTAGPHTSVAPAKTGHRLTPDSASAGAVYAAVGGTAQAPTHLRVWAKSKGAKGYTPIQGVFVVDRRGQRHPATDTTWPGASTVQTSPGSWPGDAGGGSGAGGGFGGGFGGGGGGGGQHDTQHGADLHIELDDNGRVRKLAHNVHSTGRSDSGGGGGNGGGMGGGMGVGQDYATSGQQQGAQSQQQGQAQGTQQQGQDHQGGGHQQGNPVTRLANAVTELTSRVENLERKPK